MSKKTSGTKESIDTDQHDDLPEWVDGADSREDAIAAVAWDHAHRARTALTGEEIDPETAKHELRVALAILEEV